jgi:hypothetical protein
MRSMMRHRIGGLGSVFEMSWAEITHLYEDLVSWFIPRAGVETYRWWRVPRAGESLTSPGSDTVDELREH